MIGANPSRIRRLRHRVRTGGDRRHGRPRLARCPGRRRPSGRADTVDATRIGMGGGSYGGFMTSWAIGHTDRFAAALVERCVSNWETFAGTSDIGPWFGRRYGGATVESDVESLRRQSPITYAANNSTPTLILHSEQDWRCPPEQAEQLFAAYRRAGVDTTFVRFPGENHELSRSGKPRHRVERFVLIHDFFARHLGGGRFEL
ncbi:MAG: prolyl oligopeptidase family serine peptidase [Acidimicrobiales bacterium]